MAILTTGNTFANGDQVTAATLNSAVNDAEFAAGAVDNTSTQLSGTSPQQIIVKDGGISTGKIAAGAVTTAKIASDVVINTSGNITGAAGAFTTLSASGGFTGNVTGNVTGNLTGNVTGDVTGNISGNVTGGTGSFTTLTASDDANFDSGTLFVDASADSVGIGTTSPSNTLHVENTTSSGVYINYDGQSNTDFGLRVESNASGGNFESDFVAGGTALLDLYANSATVSGGDFLVARTQSATPVLLVKGNGNVGIGTTSPSHKLEVNSGATNQVALFESTDATAYIELADNTGSVQFITPANGALRIATGGAGAGSIGTSGLFIDQSQNVGIGDDTPSYKLDVNGDIRATGAVIGNVTGNVTGNLTGDVTGDVTSTGTSTFSSIDVNGGAVDGTTIGASSASTGAFTTLTALDANFDSGTLYVDPVFGGVGINTTSPNAVLDIVSNASGVIVPRMTTTEMNAIGSPTNGEIIYNTTANKFYGYAGGTWVALH